MSIAAQGFRFGELRKAYARGEFTAQQIAAEALRRARSGPGGIWISLTDEKTLQRHLDRLADLDPAQTPLYGLPFAIKDNIDLHGLPTTAACPAFSYEPAQSAFVVQRLIDAGAIPIGKTNLDQFATGLSGLRSPYGICHNAFDTRYAAGGSSSGSAVAVALEQVSFALGTDTAGSGRVPAAFNNIVGWKPGRGLLSTAGVVPACRSLDCVSIFALSAVEADAVFAVAARFDPADAFARALVSRSIVGRRRIGAPLARDLHFEDPAAGELFEKALFVLQSAGYAIERFDPAPFYAAAALLYDGPWLAERFAAVGDFIEKNPQAVLPITREIIGRGAGGDRRSVFEGNYRLAALRREADSVLERFDFLVFPTTSLTPTIEWLQHSPIEHNAELGRYTNFVNLLDLCAIALPAGLLPQGVPWGITLIAPAMAEAELLHAAREYEVRLDFAPGARPSPTALPILVCGAHMGGLPLNRLLTERGARFLEAVQTAPCYRLFALPGGDVQRPGLLRVASEGRSIAAELWALPASRWGEFIAEIPAPLGIGRVTLNDGRKVSGFLCEAEATAGASDISELGGWRQYLATL